MTDELDKALAKASSLQIVYSRRPRCTICQLSAQALLEVHGAIWDVPAGSTQLFPAMRTSRYAADAQRVLKMRGISLTTQSVTNHVKHVEDTAKIRTYDSGNHVGERRVFATDYKSITDTTARLGMLAADALEGRITAGDIDDRALVSVLSTGQRARTEEQKLNQKDRHHDDQLKALFLLGGGLLGELPDSEAHEVIDVTVLRAELEEERRGYYIDSGALPEDEE